MNSKKWMVGLALAASLGVTSAWANSVPKDLPYPQSTPTADEVAKQVYFVNHFYSVKNFSIKRVSKKVITVLLSRSEGSKPKTNTVERHLNNDYDDGVIKGRDVAIFRSGKLRGTGMLITDFVDDAKSQSYSIWLPALRKIRRFAQPAHDDAWGGTDFTFGDVTLRKPQHETHELLGTETMNDCLMAMEIPKKHQNKYSKNIHGPDCSPKGRSVYKLKSTTLYSNWWYDYRISLVDTQTFGDYRTEYFKDGKKIKIIDRAWTSMKLDDPRGLWWKYWYGKNLLTNHETMASIPDEVAEWNSAMPGDFWSEKTLRKIKR
ncbi:MAG: outer membrane lipoprotein-sorting protein [Magnetococcales bacterium]|nr:outer membrane lipoprotein-sorting protein [Magnetococcales bacterium]